MSAAATPVLLEKCKGAEIRTPADLFEISTTDRLVPTLVDLTNWADHRVALKSMVLDFSLKKLRKLDHALTKAHQRGVDVSLHCGRHTMYHFSAQCYLDLMAEDGIPTHVTDAPYRHWTSNPTDLYDTDHSKVHVFDTVALITSANLEPLNLHNSFELTIKTTYQPLVEQLYAHIIRTQQGKLPSDEFYDYPEAGVRLLIDSGQPQEHHSSITMESALEMVRRERSWIVYIGQHLPDDPLRWFLLDKARKGTHIYIVTPHPGTFDQAKYRFPAQINHFLNLKTFREAGIDVHIPGEFPTNGDQYDRHFVHAKALLTSSQGALVGSHNLLGLENRLRTANVSLQITNSQMQRQLYQVVCTTYPHLLARLRA